MTGSLLRSGGLKEFFALGAVGHPVYMSATQLRVAIRNQLGADIANIFAIPQRNERGDSIDWYAPQDGNVVPWSAATEEERAAAKTRLEEIQQRVATAAQRLENDADSERQVFGRLLSHAMTFPDDAHVYLVNDQPVLTFWGFRRHDMPSTTNALGLLPLAEPREAEPVLVEPVTAPVEAPRKRRLPWWLWLLLLLLLLLLALFLLRACQEQPVVIPQQGEELRPQPDADMPEEALDPENVRERERLIRDRVGTAGSTVIGTDGETLMPAEGELLPEQQGEIPLTEDELAAEEGVTDENGELVPPLPEEGELPGSEEPGADEQAADDEALPEELPPQDETMPPEQGMPEEPAEEPEAEEPLPGETQPENAQQPEPPALNIPPQALQQGNVEFLKGDWSSSTGLMDERGRPMQLEYQFDDQGEGTVSLRRSDGSVCRGKTRASTESGQLVITDQENITCPDGRVYQPSRVNCEVGKNGEADCQGGYDSGNSFPVEIRQSR